MPKDVYIIVFYDLIEQIKWWCIGNLYSSEMWPSEDNVTRPCYGNLNHFLSSVC